MRLYPPHILRIFIRNRQDDGMTPAQIAAWLRAQLRWDAIDPATMDEYGRRRYGEVDKFLRELEGKGPS